MPVGQESHYIQSFHTNEEDVIAWVAKYAVKELIMIELSNMAKESLNDILSTSFHNAQISIWSTVCNVVEHVIMDRLRMDFTGETLEAHIANIFDSHAALYGLWRRLLPSFRLWRLLRILLGEKPIQQLKKRSIVWPGHRTSRSIQYWCLMMIANHRCVVPAPETMKNTEKSCRKVAWSVS